MTPIDIAWKAYEARNHYVNHVAWAEQPPCGAVVPPTLIVKHRHACKFCKKVFYPRAVA